MKRRRRDIERREFKRLEISIPLCLKLLGISGSPASINTEIMNISPEGIMIELNVTLKDGSLLVREGEECIKLIPYLVLSKKLVELEMTIPQKVEKIKAAGRIIWYDLGSMESSYYFQAGIVLEEMEDQDRKVWEEFVEKIAQLPDKESEKRLI